MIVKFEALILSQISKFVEGRKAGRYDARFKMSHTVRQNIDSIKGYRLVIGGREGCEPLGQMLSIVFVRNLGGP